MKNEPPRVLLVDDEVDNLDTFRRVFRRDFAMSFARSGAEALALLGEAEFDFAFVDYAMAEMDGLELMRRAAALRPSMARLMLTAHDGADAVRRARLDGLVVGIVPKPWQREQILQIVGTVQSLERMRVSVEKLRGPPPGGSR
jgi:CheY-like chemotaxis protein